LSKWHKYDTVDSTNNVARAAATGGAEHGSVFLAERQTAGRGRHGKAFFSPPKHGIYMSIVLRHERLGLDSPELATVLAAAAVCDAVEKICGKSPQIKWINDIFLDGKKIGGILAENIPPFIILGVGINFTAGDFPKELRDIAGAVFCGEPTALREELAAEIVKRILEPRDWAEIIAGYRQRLFMLGCEIVVNSPEENYTAVACDVDERGRLLVRSSDGGIRVLSAGEISVKTI